MAAVTCVEQFPNLGIYASDYTMKGKNKKELIIGKTSSQYNKSVMVSMHKQTNWPKNQEIIVRRTP